MGRDFTYRWVAADYNEDSSESSDDDDYYCNELPFKMPRRGYVPIYDGVYTREEALESFQQVAEELSDKPDMGTALAAAAWAYLLSEWDEDDDNKVSIIYG